MSLNPENDLLFTADPAPQLVQLAHLEPNDRPIVSCYLDTRSGVRSCLAFLNEKAAHIRGSLKGVDRLEFDSAIEIIRRNLDDVEDGTQGIAFFSRGALSDRFLTSVTTPTAPDNRLVYGRSPEILPLVALQQNQPAGHLLVASEGRFELLRTDLPPGQEPCCSGQLDPQSLGTASDSNASTRLARPGAGKGRPASGLGEMLRQSHRPLLVAGDADALVALSDWLPDEAVGHLVGCIRLSEDTARPSLLEIARNRLNTIFHSEAQRLARDIVEREPDGGTALGFRTVLEYLRQHAVDTVIVSDWDRFGHGLPWESKVEICFEALRHDARVILCDSIRLRDAGGVGCVLRNVERPVDQPAVGQARLQQVA
jgi:hypothetical protein